MPPKPSNVRLKSARLAAGYHSQQALAAALGVGVRQVRRWESENPPWPHPELGEALTRTLGQDLDALGFSPPDGRDRRDAGHRGLTGGTVGLATVPAQATATMQPASVAPDFEAVTRSHRRLYWSVAPATLRPAAIAHAALGCALLPETAGQTRRAVAAALAETWLLAGRIEFFDLCEPDHAGNTLLRALQAAGEADDPLLGSAVLAHMAFIPAWAGRRDDAAERMVAARTYARRGAPSAELLAWLDAVEAECETRCGNIRTALHLIGHAEDVLDAGTEHPSPDWLDWFSPVRLGAFKGNTQLKAGHLPQARTTLLRVLEELPAAEGKQRSVVYGDLAAVEAAAGNPDGACEHARRALDQLEATWYATGMDRVREVRRALAPHQHEQCVRDLDDRLYGWSTTVSALAR
ncbi:helix-turn-helix transcriptional regulator (plasmid) [Streptomyces castrisilvae]|uniref:Helix-turn-helix transcriptional regulator n=1 Tax=Streptomyces castrisilvae TaxID=3033811 RepID=A0ABY9HVD4_9ACTN|nr:helix-turn-helix transcriptional regulator [Streptomyces sp. Mut1]WLQ38490.1 helix-turn-helix transcriptional regulator [Streptomyces sp. Mut1]